MGSARGPVMALDTTYLATLALSTRISLTLAGSCPDVTEDPYLDFGGAGLDNDFSKLTFIGSCGIKTGQIGENATDKASVKKGEFSKSVCRVKCNNWKGKKGEAKLFWVKTKSKWRRTKYLQCNCHKKRSGDEVCRYRRRSYNYVEAHGRAGHKP